MSKLNNLLTKAHTEVHNMAAIKARVLNNLSESISKKSPQELAAYSNQFRGTEQDPGQSTDSSQPIQPASHESQIHESKDLIPKKVKSGFLPRKC